MYHLHTLPNFWLGQTDSWQSNDHALEILYPLLSDMSVDLGSSNVFFKALQGNKDLN